MYYYSKVDTLSRVTLSAPLSMADREILTPEAIGFISALSMAFEDRRRKLLARRSVVQHEFNLGILPGFLDSTVHIRRAVWRVSQAPADPPDRRIEVRSPAADRLQLLRAMNSGTNVCVADCEDSQSPTWSNVMESQRNIRGIVNRKQDFYSDPGTLLGPGHPVSVSLYPRAWHQTENHFHLDGEPVSASLFDFGLFIFHNGSGMIDGGCSPSVHIPKIENRFESALWNDVISFAENRLGLPPGSVRATIMIETLPAAFEMDEILHELKDRAAALGFGKKNYTFSLLQKLHNYARYTLPDRERVCENPAFLDSCLLLMVQTAHRRGVQAVSGPLGEPDVSSDGQPTDDLLQQFIEKIQRDMAMGSDGISVSQPGLAGCAREATSAALRTTHQMYILHEDVAISPAELLRLPQGHVSETGIRTNIQLLIRFIGSWLTGTGRIAYRGMVEDTPSAEISRAQLWHWLQHSRRLGDGTMIDTHLFNRLFEEETELLRKDLGTELYQRGQFELAGRMLFNLVHHQSFQQFLTMKTSQYL